ncbi:hypothetical protein KZZ52_49040 [Dactylosporangium sp. AC04546]|uniref:hypothetical protein n=1 Tax=Dactylosporangium sp. AC04546 TaxID=2862460 RepID=UPI001EDD613D|nr:hypothetical protein [Dactylosporangium sp. AC04546]WVK81835.1 hypothetical protein KZZ52_49040 [Dactylosporangium sp. AC04546]
MTTVPVPPTTAATLPARIAAGAAGGLVGGIMFGVLMQMMGMITIVAMLVGSTSAVLGWLVHLAISAFIGTTFAILFARWATSPVTSAMIGMGYAAVWWVLGTLLLMPVRLGTEVFIFNATAWQGLMGHLMYGLLLGGVYAFVAPRLQRH